MIIFSRSFILIAAYFLSVQCFIFFHTYAYCVIVILIESVLELSLYSICVEGLVFHFRFSHAKISHFERSKFLKDICPGTSLWRRGHRGAVPPETTGAPKNYSEFFWPSRPARQPSKRSNFLGRSTWSQTTPPPLDSPARGQFFGGLT